MAPTEGRVAKPERRWDCRRGTPCNVVRHHIIQDIDLLKIAQRRATPMVHGLGN